MKSVKEMVLNEPFESLQMIQTIQLRPIPLVMNRWSAHASRRMFSVQCLLFPFWQLISGFPNLKRQVDTKIARRLVKITALGNERLSSKMRPPRNLLKAS